MPIYVAEFTTNHMGNLNVLLKMAKLAKEVGADYIKMQMKDVETFYSKEKLDSVFDSPYGHTYRDYRTMFEFDDLSMTIFDEKCKEVGIEWYATAQDIRSYKSLMDFPMPKVKIASSNSRNKKFLKEISRTFPYNRDIVISVGGSTLKEIEKTLKIFPKHSIYLLHCVAEYPCRIENWRLGNIIRLKKEFEDDRIKIGYSGHGVGVTDAVLAASLDIAMIEKHFCLSRHSFVHHIECSLEPAEFAYMISQIDGDWSKTYEPDLNHITYREDFGMSEMEESFLKNKVYGQDYLGVESKFK